MNEHTSEPTQRHFHGQPRAPCAVKTLVAHISHHLSPTCTSLCGVLGISPVSSHLVMISLVMIIYPLCVAGFGTVCRVGVEHTVWVEGSQLEGRCVAECQDGENAGRYGSPGQSFSTILEILGGVLKDVRFTQRPEVAGRSWPGLRQAGMFQA